MAGRFGPIEDAYQHALHARLHSMVYFALNNGVARHERKSFRKEWRERGMGLLVEHLMRCASPNWTDYLETFYIDPWVGRHLLQAQDRLYYFVDLWLEGEPLPDSIDPDPYVEDGRVRELKRLRSALNP
jgi:hypothetical protein